MKKTQLLLIVLALSALLLGACGGESEATPTDTPTVEPAADANGGGGSSGPSSIDLSDPEQIQEIPGNYSIQMDFSFDGQAEDGSEVVGALLMEGRQEGDGSATEMIVSTSGTASLDGVNYIEFMEIDNQLYFYNEVTGCVTLPDTEDEDRLFNSLVDVGGFITGEALRVLPDETINGVPSYHFAITQENLDTSDPESMEVDEITDGHIYIARDGGYVVRLIIDGTGESEVLTGSPGLYGDVYYQLDFIPIEGELEIVPPDGCEDLEGTIDAANAQGYPVLPDAENVASLGALFSYTTATAVEDVVAFYKAELGAQGWTLDQEIDAVGTALLMFTQGGESLSVAVNEDVNNPGTINVVIVEE